LITLDRVYINGRFATQTLSGVQRFATELTRALQHLQVEEVRILVPPHGASAYPGAHEVGRMRGQVWEQWDLPRHAADGLLINLGNTAPLRARRQILVIHDTGVFSTPEAYSRKFRLWYKAMQTAHVKLGTPIVTVSEFSRGEIMRHLHARPGQVVVMPEGADHVSRIVAEQDILAKHGLEMGRFVLAVGTLAAHKNLPALGSLAKRLALRDVPLIIVGSLGGLAFQNNGTSGLPQPARYIGRVSDGQLKALYQAAACFVFPSRYEGFGLPVVEAMASFCPVVAADIPALREVGGDAVLFCNPMLPEDIADRVCQILDDQQLQTTLRSAGLERTRGMTWNRAAQVLQEIILAHRGDVS
jgi:glycosyltransferase involved in cell wall biosynthesis